MGEAASFPLSLEAVEKEGIDLNISWYYFSDFFLNEMLLCFLCFKLVC